MKKSQRIKRVQTLSLSITLALFSSSVAAESILYSFEEGETAPLLQGSGSWQQQIVSGPKKEENLTAKVDAGFIGKQSLRYQSDANQTGKEHRSTLFKINQTIEPDSQLSYFIFPVNSGKQAQGVAQYVALDLVFEDGTRLSALPDMKKYRAENQGSSRRLYDNQWNRIQIDMGSVAKGRKAVAIELVEKAPAGTDVFHGYIDEIHIKPKAVSTAISINSPVTYVDTRRGTNSNGGFSRGNTFPALAVPHGFNFWTPTTHSGSDWIYQYQERNGDDNRPRLEAFSLSHEPSPWMGDRHTFQIMPASVASGEPPLAREKRALSFSHDNEIARPDWYQVNFDNGIEVAMTPTSRAAMMQFTFPDERSQLIFDNRDNRGGITLNPAERSIHGYTDVVSGLSTGATRMFFYATFDQPVVESGRLTGQERDNVSAWLGFDTSKNKTVTMQIATSLISVEQAKHNLALEIAPNDTMQTLQTRAIKQWNVFLNRMELPNASTEDKVQLYSNLYRLFLYPNESFENLGTNENPDYHYASPFSTSEKEATATQTGARIVAGRPYVNNGFWDTYRTAWPAYTLLTPTHAGNLIDGFVQQHRDGGWIARWSSPGYADLMVGTSANIAFADAWNKGVHNFDVQSFYQSALKDATVISDIRGAGRKGLNHYIFNGYVDNSTHEGLSWSMAGYLNDFGLSELATSLAKQHDVNDPYQHHYADDAKYFRSRSLGYQHLFNPEAGFFIGRKPTGEWRIAADKFDPKEWGGDYTETNAWNMAFEGVQDPQGLANVYGGWDGLITKLDQFFNEDTDFGIGHYGGTIHEMLEASAVRMGQYGHSNQPSHHIPYLYSLAGQPWKTQDKVRDILSRLYVGSEIGQGYPGDDDNGEMSAWWLFSSAGFYPVQVGKPSYAIGAPYFPHLKINLENGKTIDIQAPDVSDKNRYIQSMTLNGQPYNKAWISHADLAEGATLVFTMGSQPSQWAAQPVEQSLSLTEGKQSPSPMIDLLDKHLANNSVKLLFNNKEDSEKLLVDNNSATDKKVGTVLAAFQADFSSPQKVLAYTLTSSSKGNAPNKWQLEGSNDGVNWLILDQRNNEVFEWNQQTRAFMLKDSGEYLHYRWKNESGSEKTLAEIELLGY